ncbi:hypothetical protein GCM10023205_67460 [Yinghuangia aomiensis]|uniref:YD repeat-containing protein n=1 Tax=Yinghuangia aomiensis TaxID=676205 RepID=A0ABP9I4Y8_9ACTN
MSVFIDLAENRPPGDGAGGRQANISYEDVTEGGSLATYEYDLLPSGALRVLRTGKGEAAAVDTVYAPGMWFRVSGRWHGGTE